MGLNGPKRHKDPSLECKSLQKICKCLQIFTNLNACLWIKCVLPLRCQLIGADQRTSILVPVSVPQLNVTRSPACTTTNLSLTLKSRNTNNKFEFELKLSRSARDRCAILGVWDTRRALLQATTSKWHNLSSLTKWITVTQGENWFSAKRRPKPGPKSFVLPVFGTPRAKNENPLYEGHPEGEIWRGRRGWYLTSSSFFPTKFHICGL